MIDKIKGTTSSTGSPLPLRHPIQENSLKTLPRALAQRIATLHIAPSLVQIEEESEVFQEIFCKQISCYAAENKQMIVLDFSRIKKGDQNLKEQLAKLKQGEGNPSFLCIAQKEDLELPAVQERLRSVTNRCSVICFSKSNASAQSVSEPDLIDRVFNQGAEVLQAAGVSIPAREENLGSSTMVPFSSPKLGFSSSYIYRGRGYTDAQIYDLVMDAIERSSKNILSREGASSPQFTEEAKLALCKIYTFFHRQGFSPDQIAQEVSTDTMILKEQNTKEITQSQVLSLLQEKWGSTVSMTEDDFKYVVDPALTPSFYQMMRQVKAICKFVWFLFVASKEASNGDLLASRLHQNFGQQLSLNKQDFDYLVAPVSTMNLYWMGDQVREIAKLAGTLFLSPMLWVLLYVCGRVGSRHLKHCKG